MHLFRAVFIFAAATSAFLATTAPGASAMGPLPLTRFMLDKIPDGEEAPAGSPDAAAEPDPASSDSSDVPVAADTPPVADSAADAEGSDLDNLAPEDAVAADAAVQSFSPPAQPSPHSPGADPVLAQENAAGGGGAPMLTGPRGVLLAAPVLAAALFAL
ncbi:hypothetical protein BD413DRAFT_612680 [Trametes elegans]|nr:hypothetical protein BD413DRAFT_612680 [Trametes elegans]